MKKVTLVAPALLGSSFQSSLVDIPGHSRPQASLSTLKNLVSRKRSLHVNIVSLQLYYAHSIILCLIF